ncbi:GlxA family transcriptional regulator [Pontivivens ytuae]|uniref:DJ-1/PfpI family protein n=1 Tax=Pontivivens ytuae TaxID=2789856 RepID=A0A7S9LV21_9RHOB|nr:DJ-1/PfpI family protein [Pontivivens ytuae]QPH55784.1 DJ-1/PfpI family protein [Pontivivens ytuae]
MIVRCLVFDRVNLLDVAGPAQVFAAAEQLGADVEVTFQTCSVRGGTVMSDAAVALSSEPISAMEDAPDIVLVPGGTEISQHLDDAELIGAIRREAARAGIVASVCTGSVLLARAGLLTRRRAATHWRFTDLLRAQDAEVEVNDDAIFVQDGPVWTSAGVSSGIDMLLALVARFWGRPLALDIARELVVPMVRAGGQRQYSTLLHLQAADRTGSFDELNAWIHENASGDCRVERLAERCGMSPRSFARHYAAAMGETPARMVERIRVAQARQLLETTATDLKTIAASCGFSSANQLRLSFERIHGVTPTAHRAAFGLSP